MMNIYRNNKLILTLSAALVLSAGMIRESWATCPNGTRGSDDASNSDYCGVNCCWVITTVTNNDKTEKILTITPALDSNNKPYTGVTMKNFDSSWSTANKTNGYTSYTSSTAPWARSDVTSVVVEKGISNIGGNAFNGDTKITSVTGMENVTSIGYGAFEAAKSLQSVDMPNVETIGSTAFDGAKSLQSVDMPNVETIEWNAFFHAESLAYAGLNPNGSVSIGNGAFTGTNISSCNGTGANCGSCGNNYIMSGLGCVADCGAGYLGKDGRCINSSLGCGAGYKDMGGFCNRIQYTPAEAAAILNDDDNTITITFKK